MERKREGVEEEREELASGVSATWDRRKQYNVCDSTQLLINMLTLYTATTSLFDVNFEKILISL